MFTHIAVEHFPNEDATFRGYNIGRKTMIFPLLAEVHYDPKYYPQPERFDPTRFLDGQGMFIAHPTMVAFGVGKRECLGKSLAKQETFLITSYMLHEFVFEAAKGGPPDVGAAKVGITRVPNPFKMIVRSRH
jgi:cytochrome P450